MTLHVLATYADMSGCGDYRVRFPADEVNHRPEFDTHVEVSDHLEADAIRTANGMRINSIDIPSGVKVVSIQRPLRAELAGACAWIHAHRPDIGLVVELDDDLAQIPTTNTAHGATHPGVSPEQNYKWMRMAISYADVLTVTTPLLAKHYGHSTKTFIVRNAVPVSMLMQPSHAMTAISDGERRTVGWAGYAGTHGGDLEVTSGALQEVVPGRASFRQIGPADGVARALGLDESVINATGWLRPTGLYRVALSELDIGIVPLADTRFNHAKSALKVLEFGAAGVPVVASKTPEHVYLRDNGAPIWLVGDRRRQWVAALNHMLSYGDDRLADLAQQTREFVRRGHTMHHRGPEWVTAWRTAAEIAAARSR